MSETKDPKFSPLMMGKVGIKSGRSLIFEEESQPNLEISREDEEKIRLVGSTLKAYLLAVRSLLEGKHRELRGFAPLHLTEACMPTAFVLADGVIIRYDVEDNPKLSLRSGVHYGSVKAMAPLLSESVIHCPDDPANYDPSTGGVTLELYKTTLEGKREPIGTTRIMIFAALGTNPEQHPSLTAARPIPILSIQNEFDVYFQGEILPEERSSGRPLQNFVAKSRLKLPVGWQAIEIYPPFDSKIWRPEIATDWAEADLLAAVVKRNLRDAEFRDLDPNAEARRRFSLLLKEFNQLLDGPEEPIHQFLKNHPQFLCPMHIKFWSKLPLGKRFTDFVFLESPNDYLLVELESPTVELFRRDGQPREELVHAIAQISDWHRYIEDNLSSVQREYGLAGISSNPRSLIVIGRSAMLTNENRRKLVTIQNQIPKMRIMTFDDVFSNAKSTAENLLGPLWEAGPNVEVYYLPPK